MLEAKDYFDLEGLEIREFLESCAFVWDAIRRIDELVASLVPGVSRLDGTVSELASVSPRSVYVDATATVEPGAYVGAGCYIGPGAVVRHGAYLRQNVVMLEDSLIGHATEAKNVILLPEASAPHFAYLGDSVLGRSINLGSGTVLSNLPITSTKDGSGQRPSILLRSENEVFDTGLTKLGAVLGDRCETGCNSVLNPGTLLGPDSLVYPLASVRKGFYPSGCIIKLRQSIEVAQRR